ncbi:MAG: TatD family hydrolase [Gammaproteobacteria bacterium]
MSETVRLVDSHCHIDMIDLSHFEGGVDGVVANAREHGVEHMLCVSVDMEAYPAMRDLVSGHPEISISVGVHPNHREGHEPDADELVAVAERDGCVAIGETGLDYFRSEGDLEWQRDRFRTHIEASKRSGKPLIIHTREAREDTLKVMREENARDAGGVMHCFAEDWDTAVAAMDMGFYISFSGIVTFKNAQELKRVAEKMPEDLMLVETDAPYLAPVPKRGKSNVPGWTRYTAEHIAELRGSSIERVAEVTTQNYQRLFGSI